MLATNQLQFVSMADLVIVLRDGAAAEVGTYPELLAAGGAFTALMKEAQVCSNSEALYIICLHTIQHVGL